ncbi:glycosyltransferase family A protein [Congregibacter brevis]|uniref:Glycosyltransferase family A protein n=1 Tax=Congregibacter brevis TaxID=3081201 RepID=A0ABZ0ICF3_9GAMM|nr:glycosyltransferase family A protein [Congregibacter sp. IMCC45268]
MTDPISVPPAESAVLAQWSSDALTPLVSICCTTFNHGEFIRDAVHGFLIQKTSFPFEIIVHDDASTDGTTEILEELRSIYPRLIRLVVQDENQWSKGCRLLANHVFTLARGKYIAVCDGDDFWVDPRKLQLQVDFLETNQDFVLCFTDSQGVIEDTQEVTQLTARRQDLSSLELQSTTSLFTSSACFRNEIKIWPDQLTRAPYGDLVMWSLLGDFGKGKFISEAQPIRQRVHPAGVHSMQSKNDQVANAVITNALLAAYRLEERESALALLHVQNIILLSIKLYGLRLGTSMLYRALRKLRLVKA